MLYLIDKEDSQVDTRHRFNFDTTLKDIRIRRSMMSYDVVSTLKQRRVSTRNLLFNLRIKRGYLQTELDLANILLSFRQNFCFLTL